jgi:hypothetical protein
VTPGSGPAAGGATVTITGTNFTEATSVMFGNTPATNFDVASATQIAATEPVGTAGQSVDITVTSPAGTSATTTADRFKFVAAPTITTRPANVSVSAGHPAAFHVIATGDGLSYQWQKRVGSTWVNVSTSNTSSFTGATTSNFTITSPVASDAGKYRVIVSNTGGTVKSHSAKLKVTATAPSTKKHNPGDETVCAGGLTTFTAAASGLPAGMPGYQAVINLGDISSIPGTTTVLFVENPARTQGVLTVSHSSGPTVQLTLPGNFSVGTSTASSDGTANPGTLVEGLF